MRSESVKGYRYVHLSLIDKDFTYPVHRLVGLTFIHNPDPKNKTEINHIDGDKSNNDMSNLEWCTRSENILHAYQTGLIKKTCGEDSHLAKISASQVHSVCLLLSENKLTIQKISIITGVPVDSIRVILAGKQWKDIGNKYDLSKYTIKANTKVNEDIVNSICQLLQENELTINEIANILNTTYGVVYWIYKGRNWKNISKNYDFSKYDKLKFEGYSTEEDAKQICELLANTNLSFEEIAKIVKVKLSTVSSIRYGNSFQNISKNYDFHNRDINIRVVTEDQVRNICKLLEERKYTLKEIAENCNTTISMVRHIKYKETWQHISKDFNF